MPKYDCTGNRVVYDLYLPRALKQAQILDKPTSAAVVDTFIAEGAEVAAGVKQQFEADMKKIGGLRLLGERFMVIQQAMGTPRNRGIEAVTFLSQFVESMKATGLIAAAFKRHHIQGASVAPAVLLHIASTAFT